MNTRFSDQECVTDKKLLTLSNTVVILHAKMISMAHVNVGTT